MVIAIILYAIGILGILLIAGYSGILEKGLVEITLLAITWPISIPAIIFGSMLFILFLLVYITNNGMFKHYKDSKK